MKTKEIIYGFILENMQKMNDIGVKMYEFTHLKSGAKLVYLENDDTNKCFSIGFRTLPEDSTGVCHIIEHSLLCGSKKYPTKEPFVNLLKGSMATFLNAMTAYDWTIYPVASQNDQDFTNLVSVYMDAVFAPLSVLDPKAFLQEGWHLEMNDLNEIPHYKGVVYNEMKGAMSSVEEQLEHLTLKAMYAGTAYAFNAGGDPDEIPNLTYENYQAFYHKHYHPSNAFIYLYGKLDLVEKLRFFDEEYLSKFAISEKLSVPKSAAIINREMTSTYAIDETEEEKDNTYMSLAFALDTYDNALDLIGFNILNEVLMANNEAPLKKQLLAAKIGEDFYTTIDDDNIIPSYQVFLHKTNSECKESFYQTFIEACKKLVKDGIDKKALLAAINHNEFRNKEMDMGRMPKGLFFAFNLMQSFNCDIPLDTYLELSKYYTYYKENLNNGYFERLLSKYILNSKHYVQTVLIPSKTLAIEKNKALEAKMESIYKAMSEEEKARTVETTKKLIAYQSQKDNPNDVSKLPSLQISDIKKEVNFLKSQCYHKDGINFIEHKFNTNQIAYLKFYFRLNNLTLDELPYAKLLSRLFSKLDTDMFNVNDLLSHCKTYLGGLSFDLQFASMERDEFIANFVVQISSLDENINQMSNILEQIIFHSHFDLEKIKMICSQMKMMYRSAIIEDGMNVAIDEVRSRSSKIGVVSSKLGSLKMFNFISELLENFNEELVIKLKSVCTKIFNRNNLTVSINGNEYALNELTSVVNNLPLGVEQLDDNLIVDISKEDSAALKIPAEVNYNAKAINLKDLNYEYSGKLLVLAHIINFDYLWNEVRVKGGAYGCQLSVTASGDIILSSYRDPNVFNTYHIFDNISDYLANLSIDEKEFTSYLIGAIGSFDQPMSNNALIRTDDLNLLLGNTVEMRQKRKQEMLDTTLEDLKVYSELFRLMASKAKFYTIGNEKQITESNLFNSINSL